MPLPTTGSLSLQQIATEFGGAAPHSISEYYRDGGLVPNIAANANIPLSGLISINQFYGGDRGAAPPGQVLYDTPGTFTFTVPNGVTSISVVCVGAGGSNNINEAGRTGTQARLAGGGAGGSLAYVNNITVVPGQNYTVVVGNITQTLNASNPGQDSRFANSGGTNLVLAPGGNGGVVAAPAPAGGSAAGGAAKTTGGVGTVGYGGAGAGAQVAYQAINPTTVIGNFVAQGGGGAGGYAGSGGNGGGGSPSTATSGTNGGGGGGSDTFFRDSVGTAQIKGGIGGGVHVFGQGANGAGAISTVNANGFRTANPGGAGSVVAGTTAYGHGGAAIVAMDGPTAALVSLGGTGAVRIIWPGNERQFPSTRTANE